MTLPRGIRNNNPGNIRKSTTVWDGMSPTQPDPAFVTFIDPEHGIRAIAKTLITYQDTHGLHTVGEMIGRWAPANTAPNVIGPAATQDNNDTEAYKRAVSAYMGIGVDDPFSIRTQPLAAKMIFAITHQENGACPYGPPTIAKGLALAGIQ